MIGIDEVGRGCWAGPLLVVSARQIGDLPATVADSKLLSRKIREKLYYEIQLCCELGEGWVSPDEIDHLGLTKAMKLGVARSLTALGASSDEEVIMDGHINYCEPSFTRSIAVVDADATHPIVSAASIYAKVVRDRYMAALDGQYSVYQFAKHVGYGTALHRQMLAEHGVSDLHRVSFKPVAAFVKAAAL